MTVITKEGYGGRGKEAGGGRWVRRLWISNREGDEVG